jgi:hypothetical protein
MAREHATVLSSDEVEALSKAFDRAPTPHVLQRSSRLKSLIKIGAFASGMIFLSYGEMTQHDTQIVVSADQAQGEPTWLMLQRFPLVLAPDAPWPEPDLTLPPLALLSLPKAITPRNAKPLTQITTIRAGDNLSSGDLTRQAAASAKSIATGGSTPVKISNGGSTGTSSATGSPKPSVKTAASNPLTTLVSAITSGFKQAPSPQSNGGTGNKTPQSTFGGSAIGRAIDSARSTNSSFGGSGSGNKSFGGQSFGGLKKG